MPFSECVYVFLLGRKLGVQLWVYFGDDCQCSDAAVPFTFSPAIHKCASGLPHSFFFFFYFIKTPSLFFMYLSLFLCPLFLGIAVNVQDDSL